MDLMAVNSLCLSFINAQYTALDPALLVCPSAELLEGAKMVHKSAAKSNYGLLL